MIGRVLFVALIGAVFATGGIAGALPPDLSARLDEIFDKRIYETARPPDVRWLDGGTRYAYLQTPADGSPELMRCESATGTCEVWVSFKHLRERIQAVDPSVKTITGYLLSPDGARLFVGGLARTEGRITSGDLWVYERATDTAKKLATDVQQYNDGSALSPDGAHLAFMRAQNLFVVDTRSGRTTQLTKDRVPDPLGEGPADPPISFDVAWSSDGERLAFVRSGGSVSTWSINRRAASHVSMISSDVA